MNSYEIKQRLIKIYRQPDYYTNRRKANKKYYSKEINQEKKRAYMKEYAARPENIAKRKKLYQKNYHKKRQVRVDKKAYVKMYNSLFCTKVKRHEWYVNKKIKDYEKEKNENLHAQNAERFTNV